MKKGHAFAQPFPKHRKKLTSIYRLESGVRLSNHVRFRVCLPIL